MTDENICYCGEYGGGAHTKSARCADSRSSKERVHDLKCWPPYFAAVADGSKPFEVRLNDRDYHVDDILRLREWDYDTEVYTGREVRKRVTYMTAWAQQENHVVMGLADVSPTLEPPAECQHLETVDLEDSNARWCTECGAFQDGTQWIHSRRLAQPTPAVPADELARDIERKFMVAVMEADDAFTKAGATGTKTWIREYLLDRLEANGIGIGMKEHLRASQPPDPGLSADRVAALVKALYDLKDGIAEHATDVVWYSAIQTACDRIAEIAAALSTPTKGESHEG